MWVFMFSSYSAKLPPLTLEYSHFFAKPHTFVPQDIVLITESTGLLNY